MKRRFRQSCCLQLRLFTSCSPWCKDQESHRGAALIIWTRSPHDQFSQIHFLELRSPSCCFSVLGNSECFFQSVLGSTKCMSLEIDHEVNGFKLLRLLPGAILNPLSKGYKMITISQVKKTNGACATGLHLKILFFTESSMCLVFPLESPSKYL